MRLIKSAHKNRHAFRRGVYYATTSVSKTAIRTRCSRFIMDKTYIVYKLAFDIKIDNFFEEFMLLLIH